MAPRFAVTAIGRDRPGMVAALTGALAEAGCNLEDSTMARLGGQFAILLVLAAPEGTRADEIETAMTELASLQDLVIAVRPTGPRSGVVDGDVFTVSVHGADHPGIVHAITTALADHDANIIDVSTRLVGSERRPAYVMILDVDLPDRESVSELRRALASCADRIGVDVVFRRRDSDLL